MEILSSGATLNSGVTLKSHSLSTEKLTEHWIDSVYIITAMSPQDVCILDCSPTPKFMKCSHDLLPSFFAQMTIFKWKNLMFKETRLWSKVIFSQRVQGWDMHKHVWFVHITDCYYSGKRNSNKFFPTTKFPFVQSHPIFWWEWLWTNLLVFICRQTHAKWTGCFCIWERQAVVV